MKTNTLRKHFVFRSDNVGKFLCKNLLGKMSLTEELVQSPDELRNVSLKAELLYFHLQAPGGNMSY